MKKRKVKKIVKKEIKNLLKKELRQQIKKDVKSYKKKGESGKEELLTELQLIRDLYNLHSGL